MRGRVRAVRRTLPALGMMAIIFLFSHQGPDQFPAFDFPGIDKLAHAAIFALLAVTVLLAQPPSLLARRPLTVAGGAMLFCVLYGLSDEVHQAFVPGRFPDVFDLVADTMGSFLVVSTFAAVALLRPQPVSVPR